MAPVFLHGNANDEQDKEAELKPVNLSTSQANSLPPYASCGCLA